MISGSGSEWVKYKYKIDNSDNMSRKLAEMEDGSKKYFVFDRNEYVQIEKYRRSMVTGELEHDPITIELYPKELLSEALDNE